jgi:magnesium-transporting ATPase (P-type)
MDTSVSTGYGRVVNLGLANDRLMFILIGGFVFVGGIILYGVFKAKQTKEDEINEQVASESRRAERKTQALDASKAISAKIAKDFVYQRFAHAGGIAFLVTFISQAAVSTPDVLVWLFYVLMVALMFRPMDHRKTISQGWLLASMAMVILVLKLLIQGLFFRDHDYVSPMNINEVIMTGVFLIPAVVFYLVSKRFAAKSRTQMDIT